MVSSLLPLLGCGVMMAACMLLMGRGRSRSGEPDAPEGITEVAQLRDEVARLRALDDQRRAASEDPGR